ncbi:hypothetical protein C8R47DRAFT_647666 [Mycena vitilis]|nr:hypothetical protein C8R47DRAFT_647666 [Mycena vitilis]
MATRSYTIYSHYDPAQRKQLERETGQIPQDGDEIDPAEVWEAEALAAFQKRQLPPPRFVPAAAESPSLPPKPISPPSPAVDVAGWYRSLTKTTNEPRRTFPPSASAGPSTESLARVPERRDKNNWFIMNAITSEPAPVAASPSTLADILARDPPPLPHEERYNPPVFLSIGPANKGFAMLQNSGWSEGEPLGPDVVRRPMAHRDTAPQDMIATSGGTQVRRLVKEEVLETPMERKEGPAEIIDLTLSDSDSSEESDDAEEAVGHDHTTTSGEKPVQGSTRKALITPISTVLKSDRLGIGLKAKTVGPYKASQKRITHNAAAMLAHTKAAEELRKQKKRMGRGHRGFARQRKVEEANRRDLLAYMNTG